MTPVDYQTETSLALAEALLEQEHKINARRVQILADMMFKLAEKAPGLQKILESELAELQKLDKNLREIEQTSASILS